MVEERARIFYLLDLDDPNKKVQLYPILNGCTLCSS